MSDPVDLKMEALIEAAGPVHNLNTGVPHAVVFVEDLESCDILKNGAAIRYHDSYEPNGTNVNFVSVIESQHLSVRTY